MMATHLLIHYTVHKSPKLLKVRDLGLPLLSLNRIDAQEPDVPP